VIGTPLLTAVVAFCSDEQEPGARGCKKRSEVRLVKAKASTERKKRKESRNFGIFMAGLAGGS
jgi:hypothetical protein